MSRTVGVMASDHISVGVVENHKILGSVHVIDGLLSLPADSLAPAIYREISRV